jgi:TolB-like protein
MSSPTCGTYRPRPKSERLSVVMASKPMVGRLVRGLVPVLTMVASRITGRVTPWRLRSPVTSLAVLAALLLNGRTTANQPPRSVAVLAFLDLTTQTVSEEYFADGMTEALIDKLSKIPDLHVPPPTSSLYFKGKRATVAEIARSLGVAYLLDGSVRKSDATLRISARLVRAADGYVVWSETYDRLEGDKLWIQEDIANEVSKALRATIH